MEQLIEQVIQVLQTKFFIELEASGRHVHLTKEVAMSLFGHPLTEKRPLSQPGQFVCNERITLVTEKGRMENVAILGPERRECQVELSLTDCVTLGLSAPIRLSGSIEGSPGITLINGAKTMVLSRGVIVAQRHIHMTPEDAAARNIKDGDVVKLQTLTRRPLIFDDTVVRVSKDFRTYVHLDYDEANACGYQKGDLGMIL